MPRLHKHAWRKLREWTIRYAPAEISGTVCAFVAFWASLQLTGSLAAAAIAGTIGENIGYYGMAASRETLIYWREHRKHPRWRRVRLTASRTLRDMMVEFGPAEILDSLVVRPGLFYILPATFSSKTGLALIAAKLAADLVFYSVAIVCYELRKHVLNKSPTKPEPETEEQIVT